MPVSWTTLFRLLVMVLVALHVFYIVNNLLGIHFTGEFVLRPFDGLSILLMVNLFLEWKQAGIVEVAGTTFQQGIRMLKSTCMRTRFRFQS